VTGSKCRAALEGQFNYDGFKEGVLEWTLAQDLIILLFWETLVNIILDNKETCLCAFGETLIVEVDLLVRKISPRKEFANLVTRDFEASTDEAVVGRHPRHQTGAKPPAE